MNEYRPDILDCISNLSSDEVFTSPRFVNEVLDMLPANVWEREDYKWLDPGCKTGVFLREIYKRLIISLEVKIPDAVKRREHILKNMLFGIAITELTGLLSRRTLYYSKDAAGKKSVLKFSSSDGNIWYEKTCHNFKKDESCSVCGYKNINNLENVESHAYAFIHKTSEEIEQIFNMKFNVIIGNPPYQLKDGGAGASAKPLYNLFVEQAKKLKPDHLCMIIPSRWFAGGKGLDSFREGMLNDKQVRVIKDFPDGKDSKGQVIFPGTSIKGGIMYFLWSSATSGECIFDGVKRDLSKYDVLIRNNSSISILEKVVEIQNRRTAEPQNRRTAEPQNRRTAEPQNRRTAEPQWMSEIVGSRMPFGFPTNFKISKLNSISPEAIRVQNLLPSSKLQAPSSKLQAPSSKLQAPSEKLHKLFARGSCDGFVTRNEIEKGEEYLGRWKVLLAKASEGKGDIPNKIIGFPIKAEPNDVCTETYLVVNSFKTESEANNFFNYVRTKFFRFMVGLVKNTQDNSKETFRFVPNLAMNEKWSDEKLYKYFKLTNDEIQVIESMIKEMLIRKLDEVISETTEDVEE